MSEAAVGTDAAPAEGGPLRRIHPDASIYDLTEEHPELINILKDLGFLGVARPAVRNTLGRVTTLAQGCERQGKDLGEVLDKLRERGFIVTS